ncbi:MAG: hypothetical protein ACK5NK_16195 [Niabella sp.]
MYLKSTCFIIVVSVIFSCNFGTNKDKENAILFSDKIVQVEQELSMPLAIAEENILAQMSEVSFDEMAETAADAVNLINAKINDIKQLQAKEIKNGDSLQITAIQYFEFIKRIYTSYQNIATAKNETDRNQQILQLDSLQSYQEKIIHKMQNAQHDFATTHGFIVDGN